MLPAMIRITDSCPSIVSRVWLVSAFKGALQGFSNCFIHLFCSRVVLYLSPLLAAGFPVTVTKNNPVMMNHILKRKQWLTFRISLHFTIRILSVKIFKDHNNYALCMHILFWMQIDILNSIQISFFLRKWISTTCYQFSCTYKNWHT